MAQTTRSLKKTVFSLGLVSTLFLTPHVVSFSPATAQSLASTQGERECNQASISTRFESATLAVQTLSEEITTSQQHALELQQQLQQLRQSEQRTQVLQSVQDELARAQESSRQTIQSLQRERTALEGQIQRTTETLDAHREAFRGLQQQRSSVRTELETLHQSLRIRLEAVDVTTLTELEQQQYQQILTLLTTLTERTAEIDTLETRWNDTLNSSYSQIRTQDRIWIEAQRNQILESLHSAQATLQQEELQLQQLEQALDGQDVVEYREYIEQALELEKQRQRVDEQLAQAAAELERAKIELVESQAALQRAQAGAQNTEVDAAARAEQEAHLRQLQAALAEMKTNKDVVEQHLAFVRQTPQHEDALEFSGYHLIDTRTQAILHELPHATVDPRHYFLALQRPADQVLLTPVVSMTDGGSVAIVRGKLPGTTQTEVTQDFLVPLATKPAPETQPFRFRGQHNLAQLLPYASAEQRAAMAGYLASDDRLLTDVLVSATPLRGDLTLDSASDFADIDTLALHFADGSIQYRSLTPTTGDVATYAPTTAQRYLIGAVITPAEDTFNLVLVNAEERQFLEHRFEHILEQIALFESQIETLTANLNRSTTPDFSELQAAVDSKQAAVDHALSVHTTLVNDRVELLATIDVHARRYASSELVSQVASQKLKIQQFHDRIQALNTELRELEQRLQTFDVATTNNEITDTAAANSVLSELEATLNSQWQLIFTQRSELKTLLTQVSGTEEYRAQLETVTTIDNELHEALHRVNETMLHLNEMQRHLTSLRNDHRFQADKELQALTVDAAVEGTVDLTAYPELGRVVKAAQQDTSTTEIQRISVELTHVQTQLHEKTELLASRRVELTQLSQLREDCGINDSTVGTGTTTPTTTKPADDPEPSRTQQPKPSVEPGTPAKPEPGNPDKTEPVRPGRPEPTQPAQPEPTKPAQPTTEPGATDKPSKPTKKPYVVPPVQPKPPAANGITTIIGAAGGALAVGALGASVAQTVAQSAIQGQANGNGANAGTPGAAAPGAAAVNPLIPIAAGGVVGAGVGAVGGSLLVRHLSQQSTVGSPSQSGDAQEPAEAGSSEQTPGGSRTLIPPTLLTAPKAEEKITAEMLGLPRQTLRHGKAQTAFSKDKDANTVAAMVPTTLAIFILIMLVGLMLTTFRPKP